MRTKGKAIANWKEKSILCPSSIRFQANGLNRHVLVILIRFLFVKGMGFEAYL